MKTIVLLLGVCLIAFVPFYLLITWWERRRDRKYLIDEGKRVKMFACEKQAINYALELHFGAKKRFSVTVTNASGLVFRGSGAKFLSLCKI